MSHNSCQLLLKRSHYISAKATTLYNNTYPHQLSLLFHASPHRTLYTPILLHTYNYTVPLMTSVYVCPAQWNPSSTQSLSCSASVSLPHHTPSTTSHKHWIYQTTCQARSTKFIIILQPDISILYVGQTRYQSKSGIFKSHFSFKFRFFLESIKCSFIFRHPSCSYDHANNSTNNPFFYFSQFSPSFLISLLVHKTIPSNPSNTPFLYTSAISRLSIFTYCHYHNPYQKSFPPPWPSSQFRFCQGSKEQESLVWRDNVLIHPCFPGAWTGIKVLTINDSLSNSENWWKIRVC